VHNFSTSWAIISSSKRILLHGFSYQLWAPQFVLFSSPLLLLCVQGPLTSYPHSVVWFPDQMIFINCHCCNCVLKNYLHEMNVMFMVSGEFLWCTCSQCSGWSEESDEHGVPHVAASLCAWGVIWRLENQTDPHVYYTGKLVHISSVKYLDWFPKQKAASHALCVCPEQSGWCENVSLYTCF
jgi:hypothetical protein